MVHWERGEPKSAGGGAREGVEKNYAERGASKRGQSVAILGSLALPRAPAPNILNVDLGVKTHRGTLYEYTS